MGQDQRVVVEVTSFAITLVIHYIHFCFLFAGPLGAKSLEELVLKRGML